MHEPDCLRAKDVYRSISVSDLLSESVVTDSGINKECIILPHGVHPSRTLSSTNYPAVRQRLLQRLCPALDRFQQGGVAQPHHIPA